MVWLMRKCLACRKYTLRLDECPYCGGIVRIPHPAKFSPDDKYLKYRMALKREGQHSERDLH
jgi:H/ACA ribonucleoprotein complex subunit 3